MVDRENTLALNWAINCGVSLKISDKIRAYEYKKTVHRKETNEKFPVRKLRETEINEKDA